MIGIVGNGSRGCGPPCQRRDKEVVTGVSGVGFVWILGIWGWEERWVWEGGHWPHPPYLGAVWVPHRRPCFAAVEDNYLHDCI